MVRKYRVTLTDEPRSGLRRLIASGRTSARKLTHARILLKWDCSPGAPGRRAAKISHALEVGAATVERVHQQFAREGLEAARVRRRSRRVYRRKLDGTGEAHWIARTCGDPPPGRERWTLRLLAERMVTLEQVDSLSHETVRRVLRKRTQAMAETAVVHSAAAECGVRVQDGGRAGRRSAAVRPEAPEGVHGRDPQAVVG